MSKHLSSGSPADDLPDAKWRRLLDCPLSEALSFPSSSSQADFEADFEDTKDSESDSEFFNEDLPEYEDFDSDSEFFNEDSAESEEESSHVPEPVSHVDTGSEDSEDELQFEELKSLLL